MESWNDIERWGDGEKKWKSRVLDDKRNKESFFVVICWCTTRKVAPLQPLHRCDGSTNNHTDVVERVATEQAKKKEWAYNNSFFRVVENERWRRRKYLKRVILLKTPQKYMRHNKSKTFLNRDFYWSKTRKKCIFPEPKIQRYEHHLPTDHKKFPCFNSQNSKFRFLSWNTETQVLLA